MKEFTYDKKKFELENILYDYTAMFNSKEFLPLAYVDLKKSYSLKRFLNNHPMIALLFI
ncbi:hypothetical protein [Clostridium botulinum]|uniref:hypothetical protein n=1 Tax=Clostridium botulinum TaxID=1491 RepID=UPI000B1DC4B2|nr:hypothetical protein [Clostridium botulinum]KAI3346207.1 hypothetical protein CIT18_14795 [Clostridium botulinum]HBJ2622883.1 hypothetical protein [Clostridium botulinum]